MKVFLYIRVACADQLAAADQREELERYAKDKGYEVAADGISGVHTEGIMNFLLNEAKRQDIGTILTRDTSRISRDTSSFMRFERKFRENGIRFEYLSKPDNELPVTPMMEAFAAAYKKRRTKNGKRA
jgi:putative resolvase